MSISQLLTKLSGLVLGADPRQRRYLQVPMSATIAYIVSGLFQWHAIHSGLTDRAEAKPLIVTIFVSQVIFFLLVRLGVARKTSDPALSLPQMGLAIVLLCWAYHINPHTRGVTINMAALVVTYSALTSKPRQCIGIGLFAVLAFAVSMAIGVLTRPDQFDATMELHQFSFLCIMILTLAFLASRQSSMRRTLREQRNRLTEALAQIKTIAACDALTGLANRRYMQDWLTRTTAQCHSQATPLCVVMMDIDHFKRINDTLGHAAGDAVLTRFATMVRNVVRHGDLVARWGGEEFVWVMVGTEPEQARQAIERLRSTVSRPEVWHDVPGWTVSFSAGLAALNSHPDIDAALRRADEALYAAKRAGRGCTLVAA